MLCAPGQGGCYRGRKPPLLSMTSFPKKTIRKSRAGEVVKQGKDMVARPCRSGLDGRGGTAKCPTQPNG